MQATAFLRRKEKYHKGGRKEDSHLKMPLEITAGSSPEGRGTPSFVGAYREGDVSNKWLS